jgi:soluble lytic murein transglycosylase-like protein
MVSLRKLALGVSMLAAVPALASDLAFLQNGFSIRHEWREQIGPVTRLYLTRADTSYVDVPTAQIDHFERDLTPPPAPTVAAIPTPIPMPAAQNPVQLDQVVTTISDRHHLDPDLVNSVIHAESGFNPRALSPKGAQGLMQLMPQTASQLGVANAFDPAANVEGGTHYLRILLEQYNFDLIKALAAYNAGPQRVARYGGVPPYYETRAYVARIIREFNRKKLAERKASLPAKTSATGSTGPSSPRAVTPPSPAPNLPQQIH